MWIEDDQAGSPEERLSPVEAVSSRLVSSRLVLSPLRPSPVAQVQSNWQATIKSASKGKAVKGRLVRYDGGRAWPGRGRVPTASEAAKRAVLYSAAYGARSTRCTALLLGTVVRTEECLSSLQGQPCLAQTDSMPSARVPNHSQHSISHSPPQSHPSWGRTPVSNTCEPLVAGRA